MEKIYLHFKSNILFEFYINGDYIATTQNCNDTISIEINKNCNFYIKFCPISTNIVYVPYTQEITIKDNNIICSSDHLSILNFSNNHFEILLSPASLPSATSKITSKNIGNYFICANHCNPSFISIYEGNVLKSNIAISGNINSCSINQIKSCIVLKNHLTNGLFEVCIADIKTLKILYQLVCENVELNENEIKTLVHKNHNSNYATICTFDFATLQISSNNIYLSKPKDSNIKKILAYQFLLALQANDTKKIEKIVSNNLKDKFTKENIENFIGKILDIKLDPFNKTPLTYILQLEKNNKFAQLKFDEENKICELELI